MSITDELMGPGSGSIQLREGVPPDVLARIQAARTSWVLVTSTYPGEGAALNREVLGALSGGRPLGGLVEGITSGLSLEVTGWSSILTGPGALDVGHHDRWWDSDGARGLGWWLERLCGRSITGTPADSYDPTDGRWLEAGSLLPTVTEELASARGWRTRVDGLNLVASTLGVVWWCELQDGEPRILVARADTSPDIGVSWMIVPSEGSAGWVDVPVRVGVVVSASDVTTLPAVRVDLEQPAGQPDSATAIIGSGAGTTAFGETVGTPAVVDWEGWPLHRWKLTSTVEGDNLTETATNLASALTDALTARGGGTTVELADTVTVEDLPPLGAAIGLVWPALGLDLGAVGLDAAAVPAMAVGPDVIGSVPAFRTVRRTVPIVDGMGVWHVDMRAGEGQRVTDLTPFVEFESGGPSIEFGDPPLPALRDQVLGARNGTTIVGP